MIMSKISDSRISAFSPSNKLKIVCVEVTDSARELERSHLCGPTAALIQAEALAGVALLGTELSQAEATITLRMRVSGLVGGVLVEASADGGLRGYTQIKVMNDLDAAEESDLTTALGEMAEVQIIHSLPGKILSSASIDISPASIVKGIEQYYHQSLQRRVFIQIATMAYGGFLDGARGLLIESLPDANQLFFNRLGRFFEDGTITECLNASSSLKTICETLGMNDCIYEVAKPLMFACRCSEERVQEMLRVMPLSDLKEMIAKNRPAQIFCHMCGKGFQVSIEQLSLLLTNKLLE